MIIAETPSLILRQMTLEDTDSLAEIYADPIVMKFLGGIRSYEDTRKRVEAIINSYEKQGFGLWATIHKKDNKFIGRCGLLAQVVDSILEAEIAYTIAKKY